MGDYLEVSKEKNRDEGFGKEDVLSVSGEFGIVNQIEFQGRSFAGASVKNYGVVEVFDIVYTKSPLKSNPYGIIKTNKGKAGIVSTLYAVYKPKNNVDSEFIQIYFELDSRMNSYMHPLVNKGAKDFDFGRQTLSISKTWDYKGKGGFLPTKNKSSVRKIQIDWQIVVKFSELVKGLPEDEPIFVGEEKIYNSTVNDALTRHCKSCGISEISIHGLRHTHASLLLFAGVSIASVARRLGHASMTTTQKTYLHIIQELENKDVDLVMRTLSGL